MEIPEFIKDYMKNEGILSRVNIVMPKGFDEYLKDKKMITIYSDSTHNFETGKTILKSKIYKTQQGFYLYLFFGVNDNVDTTIYYKESQASELTIFIKQLIKQFKNATTNSERTERKNQ